MNHYTSGQRGFSLIEALIGIAILVPVVVGAMTLARTGLSTVPESREQVTATYLAQDAMEYIVHVRYENTAKGNNWLAGLNSCGSSNGCKIDTTESDINKAISGCGNTCDLLHIHTDGNEQGTYDYDSGSNTRETQFRRIAEIEKISHNGSKDEVEITVTVEWNDGKESLQLQNNLFNWEQFF